MQKKHWSYKVEPTDTLVRIDKLISEKSKLSRNLIKQAIDNRGLKINGNITVRSNYLAKSKDVIDLEYEQWQVKDKISAFNLPLDIVYEDAHLLVINKPNNLVVHPGAKNVEMTLINAVVNYLKSNETLVRAGLIHRIDKQTTGLIMLAKSKDALEKMQALLKQRKVKRKYLALIRGILKEKSGSINAPIGRDSSNRLKMAVTSHNAKEAVTDFKVIKNFSNFSLVECELQTGRTHQIRVHMAYIKHPVLGDYLYGAKSIYDNYGQYLHAYKLEFFHPYLKKQIILETKMPQEFEEVINNDGKR